MRATAAPEPFYRPLSFWSPEYGDNAMREQW
jgi:hypothetical protein